MPTPTEQAAKLILRFELEKADVLRALQGTAQLERGIAALSDEAGGSVHDLMRAADATDALADASARSEDKIQRETRRLHEKAAAIRAMINASLQEEAVTRRAATTTRAGGGGLGTSLSALGGAAGSLDAGGVAQTFGGAADIARAAEQMPRFVSEIKTLTASLGTADEAALGASGSLLGLGAAALPLAAVVAGVGAAVLVYSNAMKKQRDETRLSIDALTEYYNLVQTGDREAIQKTVTDLQNEIAAREAEREEVKRLRDGLFDTERSLRNLTTRTLPTFRVGTDDLNVTFESGRGQLVEYKTRLDEIDEELLGLNERLRLHQKALEDEGLAAEEAARLLNELTNARIDAIGREAGIQQRIDQLQQGSSQQVQARIDAIGREKESIQGQLAALATLDQTNQAVIDRTTELHQTYEDLEQEEKTLRESTLALVQTREMEQRAIDYQRKQLADTASAVEKYNADETRIKERGIQERMRVDERYADTQVKIAQAAADAAEAALDQLRQRRADLDLQLQRDTQQATIDAERDLLDIQIEAQRDEATSAREHADRMADIRRRAQADEVELAYKRDFGGISRLRRQTATQLSEENLQEVRRRRERAIAFEQEREDQLAQYARDREDRLTKFQQDLQDAEEQYRRELRLAEEKRRRELQLAAQAYNADLLLLSQKLSAELALRRDAIQAELQLISSGYKERALIEAQGQAVLLNQARSLLGSATAYTPTSIKMQNTMNYTQNITSGVTATQVASAVKKQTVQVMKKVYN